MLIFNDRLLDIPILSLQTGAEIARISGPIIDPRQLKIVAFYCLGPHVDVNPAILHIDDIREFGNLGFIVDDSDVIMSPEGLVRLQEVLNFNYSLDHKPVIDEHGRKLGKVNDFVVDTDSFFIMKINVKPGLLRSLSTTDSLIDRRQVKEVTDTKVIVKAPALKVRKPDEAKIAKQLHNPFRKHAPQPQQTTIKSSP